MNATNMWVNDIFSYLLDPGTLSGAVSRAALTGSLDKLVLLELALGRGGSVPKPNEASGGYSI